MGIVELIAGVFKPATELIDELHTSEEERLTQKAHLLNVQAAVLSKVFEYEKASLEAQARIVTAEASSEHWLAAVWRPITMLTFLVLIVCDSMGWLPEGKTIPPGLMDLMKIGLGGYIVARSGEKIMKQTRKNAGLPGQDS